MAEGSEAIIRQNGNFNKAEQMQKERTTMRKLLKMVIITALGLLKQVIKIAQ
jgi:hypothetical protein